MEIRSGLRQGLAPRHARGNEHAPTAAGAPRRLLPSPATRVNYCREQERAHLASRPSVPRQAPRLGGTLNVGSLLLVAVARASQIGALKRRHRAHAVHGNRPQRQGMHQKPAQANAQSRLLIMVEDGGSSCVVNLCSMLYHAHARYLHARANFTLTLDWSHSLSRTGVKPKGALLLRPGTRLALAAGGRGGALARALCVHQPLPRLFPYLRPPSSNDAATELET